jgi:hypothetical protein
VLSSKNAKFISLAILLTALSACANSPNGKNLEQILAADPKLKENPVFGTSGASSQPQANGLANPPSGTPATVAQLPEDFPNEIPRYPNAQLKEVAQPTSQNVPENNNSVPTNQSQQTRWVTSDPSNLVQSFYQQQFQANNWDLNQPTTQTQTDTIQARLNDLQVTVSIVPNTGTTPSQPGVNTEFIIEYDRNTRQTAPSATEPGFIGPVPQTPTGSSPAADNPQTTTTVNQIPDLNNAPQELWQYITDLASLGVLPEQTGSKSNKSDTLTQFEPGKSINRREFARLLVAANNQIHVNRPSQQIRAASPTAQPAFGDVPSTDPDFAVIQGLAEAGLIPSRLSGDATAVLFRPNAPLTREQLILWKVPLDTRQALPTASTEAVRESWGFQDVARIEPRALRAVLADFQNGEQSNIRRAFGYTTLFQPKKPVTRAEAAAAIWYFGSAGEGISAQEALKLKQQPQQEQPAASPEPSATPQQSN